MSIINNNQSQIPSSSPSPSPSSISYMDLFGRGLDNFWNQYRYPLPPVMGVPSFVAPLVEAKVVPCIQVPTAVSAVSSVPSAVTTFSSPNKLVHKKDPKCCSQCGRTDTPLWRKDPEGFKTMCNACGIRWKRRAASKKRKVSEPQKTDSSATTKKLKPAKTIKSENKFHRQEAKINHHLLSIVDERWEKMRNKELKATQPTPAEKTTPICLIEAESCTASC